MARPSHVFGCVFVIAAAFGIVGAYGAPAPVDKLSGMMVKTYDDRLTMEIDNVQYLLAFATPDLETRAIEADTNNIQATVTGRVMGWAGKKRVFLVRTFSVGIR